MKRLWLIGGPMGVGKTTLCQVLKQKLPNSVFLDGDWCWDAHPFVVTEETKAMVLENIRFLLGQFLRCSRYENVIFCWVMHQESILQNILGGLNTEGVSVRCVSLVAEPEALEARLRKDVEADLRTEDAVARSLAYLPLYASLPTEKLDVSRITAEEAAERIAAMD